MLHLNTFKDDRQTILCIRTILGSKIHIYKKLKYDCKPWLDMFPILTVFVWLVCLARSGLKVKLEVKKKKTRKRLKMNSYFNVYFLHLYLYGPTHIFNKRLFL